MLPSQLALPPTVGGQRVDDLIVKQDFKPAGGRGLTRWGRVGKTEPVESARFGVCGLGQHIGPVRRCVELRKCLSVGRTQAGAIAPERDGIAGIGPAGNPIGQLRGAVVDQVGFEAAVYQQVRIGLISGHRYRDHRGDRRHTLRVDCEQHVGAGRGLHA